MTVGSTRPPATPPRPRLPRPQPPPRSWWSRNWKWVVPVGCLTSLVVLFAFVAVVALIVFKAIRSTDVYKDALARASTHPEVITRLGSPIEPKWWLLGSITLVNDDGEAEFAVPIRGPKGDGKILVDATKKDGRWKYSHLVVDTPGGQIDLLSAEPSTEESRDTAPPGG